MTKRSKKSDGRSGGLEALNLFFESHYKDRWPHLLGALQESEKQTARKNLFADSSTVKLEPWQGLESCFVWSGGEQTRDSNGLLEFYIMDPASVICARALEVKDGDRVLDMCAAPGGKTLILIEALLNSGEIIANELSAGRRERLKKVIQQYVSREVRNRVWVTGKDAGLFAKSHPDYFDRILVDAPCSGERHLLHSPKDLSEWSPSRSQKLAQRQYALLTAALYSLKEGGRIVYSTCSISNLENDLVIERLLDKKKSQFEVVKVNYGGEETQFGQQFFPDQSGYGPIYFSILEKTRRQIP